MLTVIFNISICQATVPRCLKTSFIIRTAKKPAVTCLNDYRLVALRPRLMRCFERLVKQHITAGLSVSFEPHQFAYRFIRSTEDPISTTLLTMLAHLKQRDSYAWVLYINFSSALNTIIPHKLLEKLTAQQAPRHRQLFNGAS